MSREEGTITKRYSESLKQHVVNAIESAELSQSEAAREYGCTKGCINHWMSKYGKNYKRTRVVRIAMKDEKERIRELESALARAHMKLEVYEKMVEFACEEEKLEIKKNTSTGELRLVRKGVNLKDSAKSSE
jgi:transposase-like protein